MSYVLHPHMKVVSLSQYSISNYHYVTPRDSEGLASEGMVNASIGAFESGQVIASMVPASCSSLILIGDFLGGNAVESVLNVAPRTDRSYQPLARLQHGVCPYDCRHGGPGEKCLLIASHFFFLFFLPDGFHCRVRRVAATHRTFPNEVVRHQLTLSLYRHQPSLFKDVPKVLENCTGFFGYLQQIIEVLLQI